MGPLGRKLYSLFTTVLIVAVVVLAILLAGVRLVGLTPYTVLSGSMEPNYHVGSLVYIRETDPTTLQVDDPVTYRMTDGTTVTHRVYEVLEQDGRPAYRTKGDANDDPDGPLLTPDRVMGRPVFTIPLLGYVSVFVQNPPGSLITVVVCALLLALTLLTDLLFPNGNKSPGEDKPPDNDAEQAS